MWVGSETHRLPHMMIFTNVKTEAIWKDGVVAYLKILIFPWWSKENLREM
jgi:hypothetical protein